MNIDICILNSDVIDRFHPPKPRSAGSIPRLRFDRHPLADALPLYVVENHAQPYVSLQFVLRSGARNDGPLHGLANFTCSMLSAGAGARDAIRFARDLEYLGADLDADSGRDTTTIRLGVLKRFLPQALDILADMILHPHFDPEEAERELKQKLAALKQNRAEPDWPASTRLRYEIYGDSPYGFPVEGDERSMKQIDEEACRRFHAEHFTRNNAIIIGAGDVSAPELGALLDERLSTWSGTAPAYLPPLPLPESKRRIVIVHRPGSAHAAIRVGTLALPRSSPDYLPLKVLNTLFGDYFNSRLNMSLREEMGFTYGAWSYLEGTVNPGLFVAGTSVAENRAGETVQTMFNELERIAAEPVEIEELETVKSYIEGHQALRMETPEQVAALVRTIVMHNLPDDHFIRTIEETKELTREKLLETAARYLHPDTMTVVIAGDAKILSREVEQLGEYRVVTDKGRPMKL